MSTTDTTERELKLAAWPEFVLPDLDSVVLGGSAGAPTTRELNATYFDTPDLRLLRRGVTLRFRRGETNGDVWTAKLPSDAPAQGLARREISVAGERGAPPKELTDITRGWALGAALKPVARLRTVRRSTLLRDHHGAVVATVEDDDVSALRGRHVIARFRELEVELVGDAPAEILGAVDKRLREAGAEQVAQVPKLTRALGRAAAEPWALDVQEVGPKPTVGAALGARLAAGVGRLVDDHAVLVLDGDRYAARRARETARILRADLDLFAPLLEAGEATAVARDGLTWLAAGLEALAELDDLADRVRAGSKAASGDPLLSGTARRLLEARLRTVRQPVHAGLVRLLRGRRYRDLLEALAELAGSPPLRPRVAQRRLDAARAKLMRPAWRALREQGDAVAADPADAALAALRTATDRVGSALQIAGLVPGSDVRRATERMRVLHDLLDEHERSVAAARRLHALARGAEPRSAWACGVLAGFATAQAEACRAEFAGAWARFEKKGVPAWAE
jgi:inorganic triphosphatase YgiF